MNVRVILAIARKELRETLRDKRTLIAMIGLPLVLYPLMIVVGAQVAMVHIGSMNKSVSRVAVANDPDGILREWVATADKVQVIDSERPREDLLDGKLEAVVSAEDSPMSALAEACPVQIVVEYDLTRPNSVEARRRVTRALEDVSDEIVTTRLESLGLPVELADPMRIEDKNVVSSQKTIGAFLGILLPWLMIIMMAMGAIYTAIDLTAGEKERGTIETLLSAPVSRSEIVWGKFIPVFSVSLITGLLNLASMSLSLWLPFVVGGHDIDDRIRSSGFTVSQAATEYLLSQVTIGNIGLGLLMMIPLAVFLSSCVMAIGVFARDIKDAHNLVMPFLVILILPLTLTALPGIEISPLTAVIPIANIALVFKEILMGQPRLENVFAVLLCTGVYALGALHFAVWIFNREEVILSEQHTFYLAWRRSSFARREAPSPGMALFLFTFMILLLFYVGAYVQTRMLLPGLFITEWLLIFLPVVAILWYTRVDLRRALNLKRPPVLTLLSGAIIIAGMTPLLYQFILWQNRVLPPPDDFMEEFEKLSGFGASTGGFLVLLLAIAVSPAICEEILFRGAILSGFRRTLRPATTVLLVGLLFGLSHIFIYRVPSTAFIGVAITYVVLRAGSIYPGMLMHFLINGLAVLIMTKRLPQFILGFLENSEVRGQIVPGWLIIAGIAALTVGVVLTELDARRRRKHPAGREPGETPRF